MNDLYHQRKTPDGVEKLEKIGGSTLLVLEEAEKHGVSWEKFPYTDLFRLQYKKTVKYFHAQIPSETTEFAQYCCKNKQLTRNILSRSGIAVSRGFLLNSSDKPDYLLRIFHSLTKPLVIKPTTGYQGAGVSLSVESEQEYLATIKNLRSNLGAAKGEVLVEEMFTGEEFRILATQTKILSVIKRLPPNVVGDGVTSIAQLIHTKNQHPLRQQVATYRPIVIDAELELYLKQQGLCLSDCLQEGVQVILRPPSPCNITYGGDTIDVTDSLHPSVKSLVKKIMTCIPGLSLAGIDFMTKDITKAQTPQNYRVIEVNSSPSLDWNEFPLIGPRRHVALAFLQIMFPNLAVVK